jgi:hypothetical protein
MHNFIIPFQLHSHCVLSVLGNYCLHISFSIMLFKPGFLFVMYQVEAVTIHATQKYFVSASKDNSWCFYAIATGSCLTQVAPLSLTHTQNLQYFLSTSCINLRDGKNSKGMLAVCVERNLHLHYKLNICHILLFVLFLSTSCIYMIS